jgi:hypothetical protein
MMTTKAELQGSVCDLVAFYISYILIRFSEFLNRVT